MPTEVQLQRERKAALREVRRRERTMDTQIEKMERLLFRLLDRKTLLTGEDAIRVGEAYTEVIKAARKVEQGVIDFATLVYGQPTIPLFTDYD